MLVLLVAHLYLFPSCLQYSRYGPKSHIETTQQVLKRVTDSVVFMPWGFSLSYNTLQLCHVKIINKYNIHNKQTYKYLKVITSNTQELKINNFQSKIKIK